MEKNIYLQKDSIFQKNVVCGLQFKRSAELTATQLQEIITEIDISSKEFFYYS